jgi:shikimate dehydrogenase
MRGLALAGGGGNVTLPHKERAAALLDVPSDAVRRTGACNTFWGADGCLHGDNTDVEGFRRALGGLLGGPPSGRVLLLGAGGAARAALVSLLEDGAREVVLLNRTPERARKLASELGTERVRVAEEAGGRFDLVVNATRLGLQVEDTLPIELEKLDGVGAVMDLVYGLEPTRFVRVAELGGEERTALLTSFAEGDEAEGVDGAGVPDPFGGDDEAYERAYESLDRLVGLALRRLEPILAP